MVAEKAAEHNGNHAKQNGEREQTTSSARVPVEPYTLS